jgi:two-component system cell cycle sensor histidine kinase/response regulator CckA
VGKPLRVLIVEDAKLDAELLLNELSRGGYDVSSERVETAEAMRGALGRASWDIVLSDYSLPTFSAPEALSVLQSTGCDLPFIIISGTIGEETAVAALKAGAHDFLVKGRLARLIPAIERELADVAARRDRARLEEQLQQSQKMEALGRLAGGVAHDFNNMLTAILGYGALLKDQIARDTPASRDLGQIIAAAERASSLTRQLLAFSHKQVFTAESLNLNAVITEVEPMLRRLIGERITVTTELGAHLYRVMADATQLEQVLLNLSVNARDAMPNGGVITIETRNADLSEDFAITFAGASAGSHVLLSVHDTGIGMTPEVRARIFEPFFTTKEKGLGTGLGLAAVYGITQQLGGFIWVESEPGHGTTFQIYLPRTDRTGDAPVPRTPSAAMPVGTETILLVEDEDVVRALIRTTLERHAYRVLEAVSAEAALALLERTTCPIDLLLTDVVLPGMDGPELAARVTADRPEVKVLLVSGYADNSVWTADAFGLGWQLMSKPFAAPALVGKIQQLLGQKTL